MHADATTSLADDPGLKSQTFTEPSITGEPPGICSDQDLHIFVQPSPYRPSLINQTLYRDVHRRCGQAVAVLKAATGRKKMLQSFRISTFKLVSAAFQKNMYEWREKKTAE